MPISLSVFQKAGLRDQKLATTKALALERKRNPLPINMTNEQVRLVVDMIVTDGRWLLDI